MVSHPVVLANFRFFNASILSQFLRREPIGCACVGYTQYKTRRCGSLRYWHCRTHDSHRTCRWQRCPSAAVGGCRCLKRVGIYVSILRLCLAVWIADRSIKGYVTKAPHFGLGVCVYDSSYRTQIVTPRQPSCRAPLHLYSLFIAICCHISARTTQWTLSS